jgi:hypothetical protein
VSRHLSAFVCGPAHRRGRLFVILVALASVLATTQAGAATVASQRAVTNFTFQFGQRSVHGHPRELYLWEALIHNVAPDNSLFIRCLHCYGGKFTKGQRHGKTVSFGANPAILLTPGSRFFIATSAPGKIGVVKRFQVLPPPIYTAETGIECTPPGVTAAQGAQHPFTVPTVACPPELIPPPLTMLYPLKGHSYRANKPLTFIISVTPAFASNEYFWVVFESKNKRARGCTNVAISLHNHYTNGQFSFSVDNLKPENGLDSKGHIGQHRFCTGPATALIYTDYNGDQNQQYANLYSSRTIYITG